MSLARRLALAAVLLAASGLLGASCGDAGDARPREPRLVLLYSPCTVNRRFLSPWSPGVRYTPNLERLARESVVFRRHVTECGRSGTDFATLLTGTQAPAHGIYDHPNVLARENVLLAEAFADAGWETWSWSGHPMASPHLGYAQGVRPQNVFLREKSFQRVAGERDEAHLAQLAANDRALPQLLRAVAADPERRAFVQVMFTVTHEPYNEYASVDDVLAFLARFPEVAPGVDRAELERWVPFYEEHRADLNWDHARALVRLGLDADETARLAAVLEALYATCIHRLDGWLGGVLDAVEASGLADEALVAVTTDHGEALDLGHVMFPWTHGPELAPDVLDVFWLLRGPGLEPGAYEAVTRSIDVFPTLAGLSGVPVPPTVEGTDLSRALHGLDEPPRQLAFSHSALWSEHQIERFSAYELLHTVLPRRDAEVMSVRVRDEDLVVQLERTPTGGMQSAAFDLARDPSRTTDLLDPGDPRHARLLEELERYRRRLIDGFDPEAATLPEEQALEPLRALGYAR